MVGVSATTTKQILLGISKRGDRYIRSLLIHGARSVVKHAESKEDAKNRWIALKKARCGIPKTCVAVANKHARIIWALLAKNEDYIKAA